MSNTRYFKCPISNCNAVTGFSLNRLNTTDDRYIICSGCKKRWITTKMPSCCSIDILFVSVESTNKKPIYSLQTYGK